MGKTTRKNKIKNNTKSNQNKADECAGSGAKQPIHRIWRGGTHRKQEPRGASCEQLPSGDLKESEAMAVLEAVALKASMGTCLSVPDFSQDAGASKKAINKMK